MLILPLVGVFIILGILVLSSLPKTPTNPDKVPVTQPRRDDKIPPTAVKSTQGDDDYPPIIHSDLYEKPAPLTSGVNTAGGEDSPFITPNGDTLYFFFTPDVSIPVEKQILDEVTGIYQSKKLANGTWGDAEKVVLQDEGKIAIDGAEFVQGDKMYFASVREGYSGIHWFQVDYVDDSWRNWRLADGDLKKDEYETGELHISPDGKTLYFHSPRLGGAGGLDIWYSERVNDSWSQPVNLAQLNTAENEGWPAMNTDGTELWFTRTYRGSPAIYRSRLVGGSWGSPELIISQFAGEPSIDQEGNIYFVHHYYRNNTMLEADIYIALKKARMQGVSLSPKSNQPNDFQEFLSRAGEAGDILRWSGDWIELDADNGASVVVTELAGSKGMVPLIEASPQSEGSLIRPLNGTNREKYLKSVEDFSTTHHPRYLGIGVEVNNLYSKSEADFLDFVDLYNEAYDAIKKVSPDTNVYTVLQYEQLKGHTLWSTEPANESKAQWWMLELFKSDAVAFTTYPCLVYKDPGEIPDNYYTEIREHTLKPIIFSEIGWHCEGSPAGWESSEEEQARFIDKYHELTGDLMVEVSAWSFLYDQATFEPFRSMGLLRHDGTSRPAWDAWVKEITR